MTTPAPIFASEANHVCAGCEKDAGRGLKWLQRVAYYGNVIAKEMEREMSEITVRTAGDMGADDARTLLNWRDWTNESIVYGLTMQQLLNLYHASSEYVSLEGWLEEDKRAAKQYRQLTGRKLEDAL